MLKFTNIQHDFRKNNNLTCNEYVFCDMIYFLSTNPQSRFLGWCYASRETLGKEIGLSKQSVLNLIKKLITLGFIEKDTATKFLKTTEIWNKVYFTDGKESLPKAVKKVYRHGKESLPQTGKESLPYNNKEDNNSNNYIDKERAKPKKVFIIPEFKKVKDYFYEINSNEFAAAKFYDHFTSNGWLVGGRSKMKDWQASARNWNRNNFDKSKKYNNGNEISQEKRDIVTAIINSGPTVDFKQ